MMEGGNKIEAITPEIPAEEPKCDDEKEEKSKEATKSDENEEKLEEPVDKTNANEVGKETAKEVPSSSSSDDDELLSPETVTQEIKSWLDEAKKEHREELIFRTLGEKVKVIDDGVNPGERDQVQEVVSNEGEIEVKKEAEDVDDVDKTEEETEREKFKMLDEIIQQDKKHEETEEKIVPFFIAFCVLILAILVYVMFKSKTS